MKKDNNANENISVSGDGAVANDLQDEINENNVPEIDEVDSLKGEVAALKEEIAKIQEESLNKYQRTLAEFDNFRKRTLKEKASMYDEGVKETITKILPVVDNFERALSSVENKNDAFYKGIDMIFKQFNSFLEDTDVAVIPAIGETFNPELHFAVSHIEDENCGENEIVEELQKGYKYKDKVIRASMVKVAN